MLPPCIVHTPTALTARCGATNVQPPVPLLLLLPTASSKCGHRIVRARPSPPICMRRNLNKRSQTHLSVRYASAKTTAAACTFQAPRPPVALIHAHPRNGKRKNAINVLLECAHDKHSSTVASKSHNFIHCIPPHPTCAAGARVCASCIVSAVSHSQLSNYSTICYPP